MSVTRASPSPSPPPEAPQTSQPIQSHRFTALKRIHTDFIRQSLKQNSYANFASCFPTPATYCPSALEGVWKQLNTRLEEECIKDFEKQCATRGVEEGLAEWERLMEDAKERKREWEENKNGDGKDMDDSETKAMHELSADELYSAHTAAGFIRAEKELTSKLEVVQEGNTEMMRRIQEQRQEMKRLVELLEGLVGDVEGAAGVIEQDELRDEIKKSAIGSAGEDVEMGG